MGHLSNLNINHTHEHREELLPCPHPETWSKSLMSETTGRIICQLTTSDGKGIKFVVIGALGSYLEIV